MVEIVTVQPQETVLPAPRLVLLVHHPFDFKFHYCLFAEFSTWYNNAR